MSPTQWLFEYTFKICAQTYSESNFCCKCYTLLSMKNFLQKYWYSKNVSVKNSILHKYISDVSKEIIFHYFYERHFKIIKFIFNLIISYILMNL